MSDNKSIDFLHKLAFLILLGGASGSLILMLRAGQQQRSVFLIILFAMWVFSPFVAVGIANVVYKRRSVRIRAYIFFLTVGIALISLVAYSLALRHYFSKTAFPFLIVPFISWIFISIIAIAGHKHGRNKDGITSK